MLLALFAGRSWQRGRPWLCLGAGIATQAAGLMLVRGTWAPLLRAGGTPAELADVAAARLVARPRVLD
eukprot:7487403-Alexandrium_andersonii.AAC.1